LKFREDEDEDEDEDKDKDEEVRGSYCVFLTKRVFK